MAVSTTSPNHTSPNPQPPGAYLLDVARFIPFSCRWSAAGEFASVRVTGDLDRSTSPQFERTLQEAQRHALLVVLDLRELEFMDSAGVHAIVDAHERAQQAGGRLAVVRGGHRIDRLFALTGTRDVLELVDLGPANPPVQALLKLSGVRSNQGRRSTWCPS
ncbi:MAG: STAS domain-containing protein [Actinomycetota bacterium]|nr:STAS domain-containing protein [Actinomycetota bacterium]